MVDSILEAPRESAAMLASSDVASATSGGAVSGSSHPRNSHRSMTADAPPTGTCPPDCLLCDPTVLVEGLGSLSMFSVASCGPTEVPLPTGDALPVPSLLWDASPGSGKDNDGEELAP
jgi:hypothetical protein